MNERTDGRKINYNYPQELLCTSFNLSFLGQLTMISLIMSKLGNVLDTIFTYAPDNSWYILTINEVFELGGSLVREGVAHNLMRLLAEGALRLVLSSVVNVQCVSLKQIAYFTY